jgi:GNAT superfamily N-acetyltransferase
MSESSAPRRSPRRRRDEPQKGLALLTSLLREGRYYDLLLTLAKRVRPGWLFTLDHQRIMELVRAPKIPSQLEALEMREVGPNDEATLQSVRAVGGSYRENFDKGRVALVAFARGEPAGYVWLWPKREIVYPRYHVRLALAEGTVWGHFVLVRPKYRALGIFPRLWHGAVEHARARGFTRLLCMVDPSHRVSMDAHTRVGWTPVADIVSLRVLGARMHVARRVGERWHFGFGLWRFG